MNTKMNLEEKVQQWFLDSVIGTVSFWQALGIDALLSFINPTIYDDEEISKKLTKAISKIIYFAFILWLASLFL